MMLAAQTLRHSSRDWLRVLAQEATFDLKHSESKAALLTVPYLHLPATVLGDIYKFIACDHLHILEHLREAACAFLSQGQLPLWRATPLPFVTVRPETQ